MAEAPTARIREQRRQRRVVAAIVAGALALGAAGVVISILVTPTPCDDLLPAAFTAPAASTDGTDVIREVAPDADGPAVAAAVVRAGEVLGLGPVRGATPAAPGPTAIPVDEAAFVVADGRHVRIVDVGIRAVATGRRQLPEVRLQPLGADEVGVVSSGPDGDELVARYDGDLSQKACLPLQPPAEVVHLDRGGVVLSRGDGIDVVRLDGRRQWSRDGLLDGPPIDGAVTGLLVLLASPEQVLAVDLRTGEPAWSVTADELGAPLSDEPLLLAGDDVVLVATRESVVRLDGADGRVLGTDAVGTAATAAVATAGGVAVVAGDELLRLTADGTSRRRLPSPAVGEVVARGADVLVVTEAGLAVVGADGQVRTADGLPAAGVAVTAGYTVVSVDVGTGLLAFYGPTAPSG